jgi:uncharacterized membrane protein HdeD (DUF308 family)
MQSSQARLPTWYRAVAVVFGVITVGLAFLVLADPTLGLAALVLLLAFALLLMGVDRIIAGITGHPFGWMPSVMREVASGSPPGSPPAGGPSPPR